MGMLDKFNNVRYLVKFMVSKKGDLEFDILIPWMIGIGFLVIALVIYLLVSGKMGDAFNFFKDLVRFGR